jgi:hypothetical protein
MATASTQSRPLEAGGLKPLDVLRVAIAGGTTAAALLRLCWLGTFIPLAGATHAYIELFTTAPVRSGLALAEGFCWSLLFGALAGAVFAMIYNATAPRRRS